MHSVNRDSESTLKLSENRPAGHYFVDIGDGDLLVKHHNINSDLKPIMIGRIALRGDHADFRAVSGETAVAGSACCVFRSIVTAHFGKA